MFSRSTHDFRQSVDKKYAVDGGFEYLRVVGDPVMLQLQGDYLLQHILWMDYVMNGSDSSEFPSGYHGRFEIRPGSNTEFYKKLIINYADVADIMFPDSK